MNNPLTPFVKAIYQLNHMLSKSLAWLTLIMAITVFVIVFARAFLSFGSIALQESITYMHAIVFMVCLAYTAQEGGHVRVDIIYRRFGSVGKAWVDVCGAILFLLPFSIFLVVISWQFVIESWSIKEGSNNPGGIPAIYLLKTLIPIAGGLLALRALAEIAQKLVHISFIVSPDLVNSNKVVNANKAP